MMKVICGVRGFDITYTQWKTWHQRDLPDISTLYQLHLLVVLLVVVVALYNPCLPTRHKCFCCLQCRLWKFEAPLLRPMTRDA